MTGYYFNWLLSQEGQKAFVAATGLGSARVDVESESRKLINPKIKYIIDASEDLLRARQQVQQLARDIIK